MQNSIKRANRLDYPIVLGFILVLGIVFFTMKEQLSMVSILISCTFIYTFSLFAIKTFNRCIDIHGLLLVILSFFIVFLNVAISGSGNFDYFKKAVMYIASISSIVYCFSTKISKKTIQSIFFINVVICVIYVLSFESGFSLYEDETLLTLHFPNPNQTGMFLSTSILYLLILLTAGLDLGIKRGHYRLLILLIFPLLLFMIMLLYLTGCRSALLSVFFVFILILLDILTGVNFKLKKWMSFWIAIFPFLFVFIYLSYVNTLGFDTSMGLNESAKTNTSRVVIWKPIIDDFWHYFLLGDYYRISNGTGVSQLHNTHLDVFASYGIIPLLIYIQLLYQSIWKSFRRATSRFQRFSLYAFLSSLIIGVFEASFVAGSGGLFLLTTGFLLLTNYKAE